MARKPQRPLTKVETETPDEARRRKARESGLSRQEVRDRRDEEVAAAENDEGFKKSVTQFAGQEFLENRKSETTPGSITPGLPSITVDQAAGIDPTLQSGQAGAITGTDLGIGSVALAGGALLGLGAAAGTTAAASASAAAPVATVGATLSSVALKFIGASASIGALYGVATNPDRRIKNFGAYNAGMTRAGAKIVAAVASGAMDPNEALTVVEQMEMVFIQNESKVKDWQNFNVLKRVSGTDSTDEVLAAGIGQRAAFKKYKQAIATYAATGQIDPNELNQLLIESQGGAQ